VSEPQPSAEPDPLIATVDFDMGECENYTIPKSLVKSLPKQNTGFDAEKIYEQGGATHGALQLTVEGTGNAVILRRLRVVELKRNSTPRNSVHILSCGPVGEPVTVRIFDVDMSDPVKVIPVPGHNPDTGEEVPPVNFPFKVSGSDPEVFLLGVTGVDCFCEWRLAIDWTSAGRSGTTVVDHGFGPIRSDVVEGFEDNRPIDGFEGGEWTCGGCPS